MAVSRLVSASDPQCLYIDDNSAEAALAATVPCRFEVEDLASLLKGDIITLLPQGSRNIGRNDGSSFGRSWLPRMPSIYAPQVC
jgi:hypothetical protein